MLSYRISTHRHGDSELILKNILHINTVYHLSVIDFYHLIINNSELIIYFFIVKIKNDLGHNH